MRTQVNRRLMIPKGWAYSIQYDEKEQLKELFIKLKMEFEKKRKGSKKATKEEVVQKGVQKHKEWSKRTKLERMRRRRYHILGWGRVYRSAGVYLGIGPYGKLGHDFLVHLENFLPPQKVLLSLLWLKFSSKFCYKFLKRTTREQLIP